MLFSVVWFHFHVLPPRKPVAVSSLFVIQGRDQGRRLELSQERVSLGRDVSNELQLHDTEVSRAHAELRLGEHGYVLTDLESSNGTYVNGERVTRYDLKSGDHVQLGRTLLLFTVTSEAADDSMHENVDIVATRNDDNSRIVHSMTHEEGSAVFKTDLGESESPWLARARSNLQVMYRTALAVSHTLDIDELLDRIVQLIFEWVEADRGCIMLVDRDTDQLVPKVLRQRQGKANQPRLKISKTILDYVMEHKEGVLTSDAGDDSRWNPAGSILQMGIREAICVPMQGRYGVVGVIYIDIYTSPQRVVQQGRASHFTDEHLKLLIAIAHQAALAVEDTSYYSAMVQAERLAAVGQTTATLSHHIKNVLQGISGGSYLVEMGLKDHDEETFRKGWSIVERNQARISALVMDMLTFSKEREPDLEESELNNVCSDIVELMQALADTRGVKLYWQPQEGLPVAMFDPEGMHRAVLNIVTNAIDACDAIETGEVVVSTEFDQTLRQLKVVVTDNGSGIPANEIEKMFAIFVSKKGGRGTGLGLSVSQKILKEHGGDIHVESEPEKGSRFTLHLPLVVPGSADAQPVNEDSEVRKAREQQQNQG